MNLFKLTQDYLELSNSFEENENLDYLQALEITKENLDNKIVSVCLNRKFRSISSNVYVPSFFI